MIIGVIGLGTVGFGVVDILTKEKDRLEKELNQEITIKYGCSLDDVTLPEGIIYTKDYHDVINDPEVDVVVELIGGINIAKQVITDALNADKHVVTANKALLAHHAKELFQLAAKHNVHLFYEASVGGGIPVLVSQKEALLGNNIQDIIGILNGTTNFILTLMETDNLDFEEALAIAQGLGFVEQDASLDLDGIDAAHKISILAMNGYNKFIDFDKIKPSGIRKVTKLDMDYAEKLGYRIKLIAQAKPVKDGLGVDVSPTLISLNNLVSNVNGAYNVVEIDNDYLDNVIYYGKGAGRYATASAVVGDILKTRQEERWSHEYEICDKIYPITYSKYYVRLNQPADLDYEEYFTEKNDHVYITKEMEYNDLVLKLAGKTYTAFKVRGE